MKKVLVVFTIVPVVIGAYFLVEMIQKSSPVEDLCVRVGEPLYPTVMEIPLDKFVSGVKGVYDVNVNYTFNIVTLHNSRGNAIGAITVSTLSLPIIHCKNT